MFRVPGFSVVNLHPACDTPTAEGLTQPLDSDVCLPLDLVEELCLSFWGRCLVTWTFSMDTWCVCNDGSGSYNEQENGSLCLCRIETTLHFRIFLSC